MTIDLHDDEARELLGPLAGEPHGPQRLDLAAIERAGGRRRLNRRLATGGLTALALAAGVMLLPGGGGGAGVPAAGYGSPSYAVPSAAASIPPGLVPAPVGATCTAAPLAGPTGQVYAVDRSGHYAVEVRGDEGAARTAVIFKDGRVTGTVALPAAFRAEVAVNASGQLAVTLADERKNPIPYVYADGELTRLKGGAGYVADIADDGRVGGTSGEKPVVWATPDAEPTPLTLPAGTVRGSVIGFDTDGTILSTANNDDNTRTTVLLWRDGESSVIEVPARWSGALGLGGIRDGKVYGTGGSSVPFRYDIATRKFTALPQQASGMQRIGGKGTVVGAPGSGEGPMWAVVDGTAHRLAALNGVTTYAVVGVANDGHTVLGNTWNGAKAIPTTWTCG